MLILSDIPLPGNILAVRGVALAGSKKIVVIGAGTMGSGIAAHLANIGHEVCLLDRTRDAAEELFKKARKVKPPHFYVPDTANRITIGGVDNSLDTIKEADWVCEAIIEKLDAKRELFAKIAPILPEKTMISTNTSGLQIELLAQGLPDEFRQKFVGTHFFNPPRYLKLLELIPTTKTSKESIAEITRFLEEDVCRRVVLAKDTPGFIANRYGMWCMFHAVHVAEQLHLSVEQVDAITGPFIGRPRSASFRLNDIVGLDIMVDIAQNLINRCTHDKRNNVLQTPKTIEYLMSKGWIGEKSGQGYTRREGKEMLTFDLLTMAYRQRQEAELPTIQKLAKAPLSERLVEGLKAQDETGEFLRNYLIPALEYADELKAEISYGVEDFDRVMRWGFGWEMGPFEMIDAIDLKVKSSDGEKFYAGNTIRDLDGKYILARKEPAYAPLSSYPLVEDRGTFEVRDLGDGVKAVATKTKMGSITPQLVQDLIAYWVKNDERYVFTGTARSYSVGYDLNFFLNAIQAANPSTIEGGLKELHELGELMEKRKIVTAVYGHCLGAGLELAISTSKIVALAETSVGLPEAKVGLIPGGRGTVLMRLHNQNAIANVSGIHHLCSAVSTLTAGFTGNPDEARQKGILRSSDVTEYHPDRLLFTAKQHALKVEPVQRPAWAEVSGPLIGLVDKALDDMVANGEATDYDHNVGDKIKMVFGKPKSYEEAKAREIQEFLELSFNALTHARIKHMLDTGKPLRN